jgi:hypothetical protein
MTDKMREAFERLQAIVKQAIHQARAGESLRIVSETLEEALKLEPQAREPEIAELKARIKVVEEKAYLITKRCAEEMDYGSASNAVQKGYILGKEITRACDLSQKWENENEG